MDKVQNKILVYENGEVEIEVKLDNGTVLITQKQLALLFEVETHTINYHIKNIFKQNELTQDTTIRKIRIVQKEGKRKVTQDVEHYNLDIIISVGYRVNSFKATKFRQWATNILKQYIINGYAINSEKITVDRFMIIDGKEAYHIGASLKDVGKKVFGFSKIDINLLTNIFEQIK